MCKAFNSNCTKFERVGHFAKQYKPQGAASPKLPQDHLETQHLSITHNRVTTNIVGKELNTWNHKKINATLRYKEFDHNLNKYVEKKPAVGPKVQVSILNKFELKYIPPVKGEETMAKEKETVDQILMQATKAVKLVSYIPLVNSVNPVKEEKIFTVDQIPMQANTAVKVVSDGTDQQVSV